MSARDSDETRSLAALERVAERGARVLRVERRHRVLVGHLDTLSRRAWIGGVGVGLTLVGGPATAVGLVVLGVGSAAALLALANSLSAAGQVSEADALARLDGELGLEDRLLTARDFLGRNHRTGFMRAAIDDASEAVSQAGRAELRASVAPGTWSPAGRTGAVTALALIVIGAALSGTSDDAPHDVPTPRESARAPSVVAEPGAGDTPAASAPETHPRVTEKNASRPGVTPPSAEGAEAGVIPEDARETKGATGEGKSAEASASQGAGQSKGVPSAQGQVSVPDPKERKKPRKKKESKEPEATPTEPKKPGDEEKSGSTAGSGAASGSNRNPSTSEWSSKDQVSETEDDPIDDDTDVEDEDSDSDARGGLQPNLRDRRPPVNRDLSVGFGNQPDEEANGRGGPSQAKKSRGTASLVLGVPIPDHIKGQPNAGRTKITQERVEPKDDEAPEIEAEDRGARSGPAGHVARPELAPWMRALIRAYFLDVHRQEKSQP